MQQPQGIFIALGGNIGDVAQTFRHAIELFSQHGVLVVQASSLYKTEPLTLPDSPDQNWYTNQVIAVQTTLPPKELLLLCQRIETQLGRQRDPEQLWGPRVIDIDLLTYHDVIMNSPECIIPHPRMLDRRFVLEPLVEIASHCQHPQTGESYAKHLEQVDDSLEVEQVY